MARVLNSETLHGVWAALITPWSPVDELDEAMFSREIRSYEGTGIHGIYTGGTTGEFYAQDDATFERITRLACQHGHAIGLPVQIGCTALSSRTACKRVNIAVAAGADGIQIAWPFWLELKFDEILAFYTDVAAAADGTPIILYHTPRAKGQLEPQQMGELARKIPTLIGVKDTGCGVAGLQALLGRAPHLAIFGGDHDLLERMQNGGKGSYSSVTGLNARVVAKLYELCRAGNHKQAGLLQDKIRRLKFEVLRPMHLDEGLLDSAIDRIQRVAGGVDVGIKCQRPYRSGTLEHVQRVRKWCQANAPELLPEG